MKRLTVRVIVVVLALGLGACAEQDPAGQAPSGSGSTTSMALPTEPAALGRLIRTQAQAKGTVRVTATKVETFQKPPESEESERLSDSLMLEPRQTNIVGALRAGPATTDASYERVEVRSGVRESGRVLLIDDVVYMDDMGGITGKSWYRLSAEEFDAEERQRRSEGDPDPTFGTGLGRALLSLMQEEVVQISWEMPASALENGTLRHEPKQETLDGVPAWRYDGRTGQPAAAASTPGATEATNATDAMSVSWTVWVGADGLPRRWHIVMEASQLRREEWTVTYTAWGEPVDIAAPPADQTAGPADPPINPLPINPLEPPG